MYIISFADGSVASLPDKKRRKVTCALITNWLNYRNELCEAALENKLETAVGPECSNPHAGIASYQHATPVLQEFHWLPIACRVEFKILVRRSRIGVPKNCLILQVSAWLLRGSGEGILHIPPLAEALLTGTGKKAFSVIAPWLPNSLPAEICFSPSLLTFQRSLKMYSLTGLLMLIGLV